MVRNDSGVFEIENGLLMAVQLNSDMEWDFTLYDHWLNHLDGGIIGDAESMSLDDAVKEICILYDFDPSKAKEFDENRFEEMLDEKQMECTPELQNKEAIDRMHILHLRPDIIEAFEEGVVCQSWEPYGAISVVDPDMQKKINVYEKEYNLKVYHVIHGNYEFSTGDIMSFNTYLYVSAHPEEWAEDRQMLMEGLSYSYVENLDNDYMSEFGMIGIAPSNDGLTRNDRGYDFASMSLTAEELAAELNDFAEDYDTYDYRDNCNSKDDGYFQTLYTLWEGDTDDIRSFLLDAKENSEDERIVIRAEDLLQDLAVFEDEMEMNLNQQLFLA